MTTIGAVMDTNGVIPKGIWYEQKRNRWRVKLGCDGEIFHRSYHRDYAEALATWQQVKKRMIRPRPKLPLAEASLINKFICQPLVGAGRELHT
jgi:hypothetical protein